MARADGLPRGKRLVRIRTELVELCRQHAPEHVVEAERLLQRALHPPGEQLPLNLPEAR